MIKDLVSKLAKDNHWGPGHILHTGLIFTCKAGHKFGTITKGMEPDSVGVAVGNSFDDSVFQHEPGQSGDKCHCGEDVIV